MSARGMWDAAKHPHGVHGHWASKGGGVSRGTKMVGPRIPDSKVTPRTARVAAGITHRPTKVAGTKARAAKTNLTSTVGAIAQGKTRVLSYSPRQIAQHGKYLPPKVAARKERDYLKSVGRPHPQEPKKHDVERKTARRAMGGRHRA